MPLGGEIKVGLDPNYADTLKTSDCRDQTQNRSSKEIYRITDKSEITGNNI